MDYPIVIAPLSEDEGGGYIGYAPDLTGCMSDGETPEEALANTKDAILEWLDTARNRPNFVIPHPGSRAQQVKNDRKAMVSVINQMAQHHTRIDQQLDDLKRQIDEIQERIDEAESWDRFSQIIGTPVQVAHHRAMIRISHHRR